ncbi:hypothetical protein KQI84_08865 [bacterium]|nr:hypothetical protein [bacterium]
MKRMHFIFILAAAVLLTGCTSIRTGPGLFQKHFRYEGKLGGYLSYTDLRGYDGDVLQIDIMNNEQQPGEILNLDLWPLGGIGIGPLGLRGHFTWIGGGMGTLFYIPDSVGKGTINSDKDFDFKIK